MVSVGRLGVLGITGWYVRLKDLERYPAVAGWRGLKDPAVREYFNDTFYAFEKDYGKEELLMRYLNLNYRIVYAGSDAEALIKSRLDADLPTLFYLWSPHAMMAMYTLSRIQLPPYSSAGLAAGQTDYTIEVIEKMASKRLAELSPRVDQRYARFTLDNGAQEGMLAAVDGGLSVMEAACGWLHDAGTTWEQWLPDSSSEDGGSCSVGECLAPDPAPRHLCHLKLSRKVQDDLMSKGHAGELTAIVATGGDPDDTAVALGNLFSSNAPCGVCLVGCLTQPRIIDCLGVSCLNDPSMMASGTGCTSELVFQAVTADFGSGGSGPQFLSNLLESNFACAACVGDCIGPLVAEPQRCLGSCLPLPSCTNEELSDLSAMAGKASLDEREQLITMMGRTSASYAHTCAVCRVLVRDVLCDVVGVPAAFLTQ